MKGLDWKVKVAGALGLLFGWPVIRRVLDGELDAGAGAFRLAIGFLLAYGGVLLVTAVVRNYTPEPEPEPEEPPVAEEGVEDAVLVDQPLALPDETAAEEQP